MGEHTARKPKGYITVTSEYGTQEADTLCCVHCRKHWIVQPGSGKKRGFCYCCNGPTCGPECSAACVPFEQWLENMESGQVATHRRILVPSGYDLPK